MSLKATTFAFLVSFALLCTPETGICAKPDSKIVVRIDDVSATRKGGGLVIHVVGMGRTPAKLGGHGQLLRRKQSQQSNKDGLLEYDLYFTPPPNYSGYTLKPVKASLNESSVPPDVKGVRIYAELNEMNAMLPEPKRQKRAPKKEETIQEKKEPAPKKEESLPKKEQPAPRKKEPAVTTERAAPRKEEAAPKKEANEEKKKSRSWRWNPFHRKPAAAPQASTPPPEPKKPGATPKKEEVTREKKESEPKKEEASKKEEQVTKKEETAPKKEETKKKSRWRLWNPFRRKAAEPEQ
ncbi:MAG: hypothetical protein QOI96_109 [Verrucomicrobiota bacterium]